MEPHAGAVRRFTGARLKVAQTGEALPHDVVHQRCV